MTNYYNPRGDGEVVIAVICIVLLVASLTGLVRQFKLLLTKFPEYEDELDKSYIEDSTGFTNWFTRPRFFDFIFHLIFGIFICILYIDFIVNGYFPGEDQTRQRKYYTNIVIGMIVIYAILGIILTCLQGKTRKKMHEYFGYFISLLIVVFIFFYVYLTKFSKGNKTLSQPI